MIRAAEPFVPSQSDENLARKIIDRFCEDHAISRAARRDLEGGILSALSEVRGEMQDERDRAMAFAEAFRALYLDFHGGIVSVLKETIDGGD